jgi:uncharacterized membrane protein YfcA
LLAAGSTIGAQVGARGGRRLRGDQIKILLASVVLLVMVKMALEMHPGTWVFQPTVRVV